MLWIVDTESGPIVFSLKTNNASFPSFQKMMESHWYSAMLKFSGEPITITTVTRDIIKKTHSRFKKTGSTPHGEDRLLGSIRSSEKRDSLLSDLGPQITRTPE